MICYLNRGFILEQAIVAAVNDYFETIKAENLYENFNVRATLEHPFAKVFKGGTGLKAADQFPAVVVSTNNEVKPSDLPIRPQVQGIGLTQGDIDVIKKTTETIIKDGKEKECRIPGFCTVVAPDVLKAIEDHLAAKKISYGLSIKMYRRDTISFEIWAENAQLKNELYEQLRLFVAGNLRHILTVKKYQAYDVKLDDESVNGHRNFAWNDQFDVVLVGGDITFEVNYAVEQIVLDTQIENPKRDLIMEVINHVEFKDEP